MVRLRAWHVFALLSFRAIHALPTHSTEQYPPYDYGVDLEVLLNGVDNLIAKRQTSSTYAITGVHTGVGPTGSGSLPQRIEIRQLQQNGKAWTLYILGLSAMQYVPQSNMLSWYQIGGIHGRPYLPFDGVQAAPDHAKNGYCEHVSIIFPPWHRPYLALFEQVLYGIIQNIAQQYPAGSIRDAYVNAAANFRVPYWDWAAVPPAGQSIYPTSFVSSPGVPVNGPVGTQTIANPLYSYKFKPLNATDLPDSPFNVYPQTVRYPSSKTSTATSQNDLVAQQLDSSAEVIRSRLYNLLTNYHDYATFSNEAWISSTSPSYYDSIESIHDQIHGLVGSGGHMTYIDYSGFDPMFMLHHAQIDRLFAIWQVLNPSSYVVPEPARYNTFTEASGQTQDIDSPLTPFHKDTVGTFWTSVTARTTETLGYQYPETASLAGVDTVSQATVAINTLYGPAAVKMKGRDGAITKSTEWIANIRVLKSALQEPFCIHIFIGNFSKDPSQWSFSPNLIGTHCVFVKGAAAMAATSNKDQLIAATIPLTRALGQRYANGDLDGLGVDDVDQYLHDNLDYRLSTLDDAEVPKGNMPSLGIQIVSADVEKSVDRSALPVWGRFAIHENLNIGNVTAAAR